MSEESEKETLEEAAGPEDVSVDENTEKAEETPVETEETGDSLMAELEKLTADKQKLKEELLRSRAELENFRKRAMRDKEDLRKRAAGELIEELLPILDNLKLGLQSAEAVEGEEARMVVEGIRMVQTQLLSTLSQRGLEEISPVGEAFNPLEHDCVSQIEHEEVPEDHIAQVVRTGFRLREKLLRAATVIVSTGKAGDKEEAPAEAKPSLEEEA